MKGSPWGCTWTPLTQPAHVCVVPGVAPQDAQDGALPRAPQTGRAQGIQPPSGRLVPQAERIWVPGPAGVHRLLPPKVALALGKQRGSPRAEQGPRPTSVLVLRVSMALNRGRGCGGHNEVRMLSLNPKAEPTPPPPSSVSRGHVSFRSHTPMMTK